ncbi:MAG: hypothetical protein IT499_15330 [Rubrivivax sp.]|nr:hypothetical protein [Rubrivivax sp.]MCL4699083.1 hypothetical protein [Burkholderiaceae bacterium]
MRPSAPSFAPPPAREAANVFPRRDQPSGRERLALGLQLAESGLVHERDYSASTSATAQLIRASTKLRACMVDRLAVPTLVELREQFEASVEAKGCTDHYKAIVQRLRPEFRATVVSFMALQPMQRVTDAGVEHTLIGRPFRRVGTNFMQMLDDLVDALAAAKHAELAKKHATMPNEAHDAKLNAARSEVARLRFWSCHAAPEEAKQGATFPQFIERVADDGSSSCQLSMCRMAKEGGKTELSCAASWVCTPRAPAGNGVRSSGQCAKGAWKLNQAQLDAYSSADASYLPLWCRKSG